MPWADIIRQAASRVGLVEVEDHPPESAKQPASTSSPVAHIPVNQLVRGSAPVTARSDSDGNALLQKLRGNVFQATEPFVHFANLQDSLRSEISDERQRWRVSFKASGLTRQALDASIQNCRNALGAETDKFASSLKANRDNDLQAKQEQARILSTQAESKRAELKALEAQYAEIVADVSQTTTRLDAVEATFKNAVLSLKSELDSNSANVATFLTDIAKGQ
jgi:chromosome segregation ATPase